MKRIKDDFEDLFRYIINISLILDGAKLNEFDRWFQTLAQNYFKLRQTCTNPATRSRRKEVFG